MKSKNGFVDRLIVVIGMDRSGTSLCMDILNRMGVDLGCNLMSPTTANPQGYFESCELMGLHDELLNAIGSSWSMTKFDNPWPITWWRLPNIQPIRKKLKDFIEEQIETSGILWGFKDPRTARLLPLWKEIFSELGLVPHYVLVVRNPLAVAQSLQKRDNLAFETSELLWLERNLEAVTYAGDQIAAIVHYEDWFIDPVPIAKNLIKVLSLPWVGDDVDLETLLRHVIIPEYKHDNADEKQKFHISLTEKLYRALRTGTPQEIADIAKFGREIMAISQEISTYTLQKPRGHIANLERTLAAVNTTIAQHEQHLEQLRRDNNQKLAQLAELESNISNLTNQNMECDQRIAQLTQEIASKNARIAELQAALANLNG